MHMRAKALQHVECEHVAVFFAEVGAPKNSKPCYHIPHSIFERAIMWSKTHSKTVTGIHAEDAWKVWTDVNQWHTWQADIDYAKLDGEFKVGNTFKFKPKGGPCVAIELTEVEPGRQFTDVTRFFGARMFDSHELIVHAEALEIRSTISIEGPLAFLWRKIVAEGVAHGMAEQTEALIERAKKH